MDKTSWMTLISLLVLFFGLLLLYQWNKSQPGQRYIVVDETTGDVYHLDGPPFGHKDNWNISLPFQFDKNYYYFYYGSPNPYMVKLYKTTTTVYTNEEYRSL